MESTNIKFFDLEECLPLKIIDVSPSKKKVFSHKAIKNKNRLIKSLVDFIEQNIANKDLGDKGEEFIFEYEKESVKKYNLPDTKEVKWVSKDDGDGLGYDILSYDQYGNQIYIEVKTTSGKESTSFYITANELLKSEEEKEKYFLYRVYNFDEKKKQGEISVRQGSLRDLCVMPLVYKVDFE